MSSDFIRRTFSRGHLLGKSIHTGRRIRLEDPRRSTYVAGAHGEGKSTLMLNLILDDIEGDDKGVVILDPHGDLVKAVAARCPRQHVEQVVYFAPSEQRERVLGLNPFETQHPSEYELKRNALMDVFAYAWYGGYANTPTLQNTLETLISTLIAAYPAHRISFLHMLLLTRLDPVGDRWRHEMATWVQDNPALAQNWKEWQQRRRLEADIDSTRQKVKHIIASDTLYPILCQPASAPCFRFQEVLSRNGVLLVNLEGLDDESQRILGSIILTQLFVMAKLRQDAGDRVPCHIYADEFYKFSPQSFVDIINEARKFRLFCTLAHQNLAQLDKAAQAAAASCGNIIVFRVNPKDSAVLGRHFRAGGRALHSATLSNLPRYHAAVRYVSYRQRRQAPLQTYKERGEASEEVAALIRERSAAFGAPRTEIDDYVNGILNRHERRRRPPRRTKAKTSDN